MLEKPRSSVWHSSTSYGLYRPELSPYDRYHLSDTSESELRLKLNDDDQIRRLATNNRRLRRDIAEHERAEERRWYSE